MALATAAGVTAVGAYLNAKYHIAKDVSGLYRMSGIEKSWNNAVEKKEQTIFALFENQMKLHANDDCIWSREGRFTFRQTYDAALSYAQFFLSKGVRRPELVSFYLTNTPQFLLAQIGLWAVGTAPNLINYNLGGEALIHCLKQCPGKLLLVDEDSDVLARVNEVRDRIEKELGMEIFVMDSEGKAKIAAFPSTRPDVSFREGVKAEDPAMVIYTSGTTGLPKACPMDTKRVFTSGGARAEIVAKAPGPNARWYNCMPLYHGTGNVHAGMCLTNGVTICIGKKFRASKFWEDVRDSEASGFVYVGETARYLLAQPPSPLDRQHKVNTIFGNGLRPDVWYRFRDRFGITQIQEFFNSTEGVFSLMVAARGDFLATAVGQHGLIIRTLLHNMWVPVEVSPHDGSLIRDPSTGFCRRSTYEEGGEMIVKVPSVKESGFPGYMNNEEATNKKFAKDVFEKGDLYYRTGDALRRDNDGRWFFLDRLGDTFRWKSENVSTAEVAGATGEFPQVVEANVYGVLVPGHDGRAGCAAIYVDPEARKSFDFAKFYEYLHKRLPRYAVPVFLRMVQDMSPMHNNKQNKVPLRNEGIDLTKVKSADGTSPEDVMYWTPNGKKTFVEFKQSDYDALVAGKSKL